ncbi:hypothetical protein EV180_004638, partial [Coemansia sp. RSA 518]
MSRRMSSPAASSLSLSSVSPISIAAVVTFFRTSAIRIMQRTIIPSCASVSAVMLRND